MRNHKRSRRKRRAMLRGVCCASIVCSVILCGAAFGNMVLVDYGEDVPKNTSEAPYSEAPYKVSSEAIAENNNSKGIELEPTNISEEAKWELILINSWNKLPHDFSVKLTELKNGHSVDSRIYPDLQEMMDDARAEGLSPIICSSYRTKQKQETLFSNQVKRLIQNGYSQSNAEREAATWVAPPDTSEHQTGLAVDIVALSYQSLDEKQASTAEQKWLMENSYKYGFILRYPMDKSDVTGISYEPWHYRYVGKDIAREIYNKEICLEEYLSN